MKTRVVMAMSPQPDPNDVERLVDLIRPILAGHNPAIQSGVLADLLSTWLAGHTTLDVAAPEDVAQFRAELLANHVQLVCALTPANEALVLAQFGIR